MRHDYQKQHEGQVEVQFPYDWFWLFFKLSFLLSLIPFLSINSSGGRYFIFLIILVINLFQCFGIPVSKLDDRWNDSNDNKEIDEADQAKYKFIIDKAKLSIEYDLEMLDIVVSDLLYRWIIDPLVFRQQKIEDKESKIYT